MLEQGWVINIFNCSADEAEDEGKALHSEQFSKFICQVSNHPMEAGMLNKLNLCVLSNDMIELIKVGLFHLNGFKERVV